MVTFASKKSRWRHNAKPEAAERLTSWWLHPLFITQSVLSVNDVNAALHQCKISLAYVPLYLMTCFEWIIYPTNVKLFLQGMVILVWLYVCVRQSSELQGAVGKHGSNQPQILLHTTHGEVNKWCSSLSTGWSVHLWKCENITIPHSLVKIYCPHYTPTLIPTLWAKQCDLKNAAVEQQHACWTFIKSQSVVSGGMNHSWLIFPFVIVGSNYNVIEKLLWCLDYTLDCKSQSWRPVTQTNSYQSNFLLWEIKQLAAWWQLMTDDHFINVDWAVQYIWVNKKSKGKRLQSAKSVAV